MKAFSCWELPISLQQASKKKVYMLYNLQPDRSVTGGAWYSDQDFESEFVEVLNQQCFKFLQSKVSDKFTCHLFCKQVLGKAYVFQRCWPLLQLDWQICTGLLLLTQWAWWCCILMMDIFTPWTRREAFYIQGPMTDSPRWPKIVYFLSFVCQPKRITIPKTQQPRREELLCFILEGGAGSL